MDLKQTLLSLLDHPMIGGIARHLGRPFHRKAKLAGLTNPFHTPQLVVDRDGARYVADAHSYLALRSPTKEIVAFPHGAAYEPEISYLIRTLIREDDVVLDIGANVGLHTVAFARRAHRGRVLAFEPVEEMAERNSINCALNGLGNVTILRCGLGAENGTLEMNVNVAGAAVEGTSSFLETVHVQAHPERYQKRTLPIRRLDDVVAEQVTEGRIGFIKIDTEGFEPLILQGGMETIRRHRPALIVEAHSTRLAKLGLTMGWYGATFPDHHVLVVHAVTPANPYLRLTPLTGDEPEIAVNLLLLPRTPQIVP